MNFAKSVATRNGLAVKRGVAETPTAQSLHPGGPYYPGQPRPPDQASSDNTSKENSLPLGGI